MLGRIVDEGVSPAPLVAARHLALYSARACFGGSRGEPTTRLGLFGGGSDARNAS
jgi:hypothetical protein